MSLAYLDATDSLRLRKNPVYEPRETAIVRRDLKKGHVFVDVGAYIGYYTCLASKLVGPSGKVVAFEPEPENFKILMKNVSAIDAKNVMLANYAVSRCESSIALFCNPANSGDNHLGRFVSEWREFLVKTVSLDEFFSAYDGRIDFVKIDTQGHEISVLEGMKGLLKRLLKLKMLVEFYPAGLDRNMAEGKDLISKLLSFGFSVRWPAKKVINSCTAENGRHCNLYAVR
jgi:FkbM family methyltransferase